MLVTALCVVCGVMLLKWLYQYSKTRQFYHDLPGAKEFSYIYGTLHLRPGPNEEGKKYDYENTRKYKYFHRAWIGPFMPIILAHHPESLRTLLKSSAPKPRGKYISSFYDMALPWLGEGLLIANGDRWARNRRLLTPAFHFDILKGYMSIYNSCASIMLANIEKHSAKAESFDMFAMVEMSALDVILRCAFSYRSNCQNQEEQNPYIDALFGALKLWFERTRLPYYFNDFIYSFSAHGREFNQCCKVLHAFSEDIIEKRRGELEKIGSTQATSPGNKKILDFLDILLLARDEDGQPMTPLEIRNEVDTFLFEGHDTTTSGMAWTLYALAQHPQYQEKVYEELVTVMGDREHLEWADLAKLEYTTMCIKESLRLHTAVPFVQRVMDEDMDFAGTTIPKGTLVGIHIWMLHHNPHVWNNPMTFDPERFHPSKTGQMDPFQFLPFSAGSRNCIGQNFAMNEMKVTVARTIKKFKLSLDPSHETRQYIVATLKAESGVIMYASPRTEE